MPDPSDRDLIEDAFGQPLNPEGPAPESIDPEAEAQATGLVPIGHEIQPLIPIPLDPASPLAPDDGPLSPVSVPPSQRIRIFTPDMKGASEEQRSLVGNAIKDAILYGVRDAALVCRGDGDPAAKIRACPYLAKCPLKRYGIPLPVAEECPYEMGLMYNWVEADMREMGINPHDVTAANDSASVRSMVGIKLSIHRAQWGAAINPEFEQYLEQMGPKGAKFLVQVGNLNEDYKERALKMFAKFSKENMQSRSAKWALAKTGFKDRSKAASELTERIEKIENIRKGEVEESVELGSDGLVKRLSRIHRFDAGDDKKEK